MPYSGRKTAVIVFAEDGQRKRLHGISFSGEEMDRACGALDLPEGTEPRWYELNGQCPEGNTFDSDDDVDWEDGRIIEPVVPRRMSQSLVGGLVPLVWTDELNERDEM